MGVRCHMTSHWAMSDEHVCIFNSEDGRLGYSVHTRVFEDEFGYRIFSSRTSRHYRIDGKVYKSKKKFLEALADFHPKMTMGKLKELNEK